MMNHSGWRIPGLEVVTRRPIERYVRCSVDIPGGSVEVGLQRDEHARGERAYVRMLVVEWCKATARPDVPFEARADELILELERLFDTRWPDRAWFVEIWNEHEALSQVYQPYGMPRT